MSEGFQFAKLTAVLVDKMGGMPASGCEDNIGARWTRACGGRSRRIRRRFCNSKSAAKPVENALSSCVKVRTQQL